MAFKYVSSSPSTNFARISKIILEPCRDVLFDVVCLYVKPGDLPKKVQAYQTSGNKKPKLHKVQEDKICNKAGGKELENEDFDISGLYIILRNICIGLPAPAKGWGKDPGPGDISIADDIERLRIKRNTLLGHVTTAEIPKKAFKKEIWELKEITRRLDTHMGKQYTKELSQLETVCMDAKTERKYIGKVKELQKYEEKTRQMVSDLTEQVEQHEERIAELETGGRSHDMGNAEKVNIGKLLIRNILQRGPGAMSYADLTSSMKEEVRGFTEGKTVRFKDAVDMALLPFLQKHKESFVIYNEKRKRMVKQRRQKSKKKGNRSYPTRADVNESNAKDRSSESETDTTEGDQHFPLAPTDERQTTLVPRDMVSGEMQAESDKSFGIEPWHVVSSTHTKCEKESRKECRLDNETKSVQRFSVDKFRELISRKEGRDILFYSDDEVYATSHIAFMQDVVSMWNTPHREISYIVLGVDPSQDPQHALVGIKNDKDDNFYQNIFDETLFTEKPKYTYYQIQLDSQCFGIIEIFRPRKLSLCAADLKQDQIELKEGQLWYRQGKQNAICRPADMTEVFQWCSSVEQTPDPVPKLKPRQGRHVHYGNRFGTLASVERNTPFSYFWKSVKAFKKGNFVLVSGDVTSEVKHLQALSRVPWVAVYDFDPYSETQGLLNAIQHFIERKRNLRILTWEDDVKSISESGTSWYCMRGREEIPESRTDPQDGDTEDANTWFKTVKRGLHKIIEHLVSFAEDYTVMTLVMLWPQKESLLAILIKFVDKLVEQLDVNPDIVLCMQSDPTTENGQAKLMNLRSDFQEMITVCKMDFESLCLGIMSELQPDAKKNVTFALPVADGTDNPNISELDNAWLKEDVEVLYLSNSYQSDDTKPNIDDEVSNFFKGGTLHWFAWYDLGTDEVAVERDIMEQMCRDIKKHIETKKSGVVTCLHAPGSGGTTFAQSALWKFHHETPCMQIKCRRSANIEEIIARINFLHDKSHLPILILVDGETESFAKVLSNCLPYGCSIVLYVKRYPYRMKEGDTCGKSFLKGSVTEHEARKLACKFGERCNDKTKDELHRLSKEVKEGKTHNLIEFGLTAYLTEFRGVVSYVKGYLQLDQNPTKELLPWQRILGYLALVHYYGQTPVPCQFFATLLNKPANYRITIEEFTYPLREFIVPTANEGRTNNIRLCHYVVAQEILEQLFTRQNAQDSQRTEGLSRNARKHLETFCIEFIEYCGRKNRASLNRKQITDILTKTFIYREEEERGKESTLQKKPKLSRIMRDIPSDPPLFTERLAIWQKLTQSFQDNPYFHAHLGRFYAYCRPSIDSSHAEKCLQKALELCKEQTRGTAEDECEVDMKYTMMNIHHMYGMIKLRKLVSMCTECRQKADPATTTLPEQFDDNLNSLIHLAEEACHHFEKSRDFTPSTHEVYLYAFTKEIEARLHVCEFVKRNFHKGNEDTNIFDFIHLGTDSSAETFVKSNVSAIENLIMACYSSVHVLDDPESLNRVIHWYNRLFKKPDICGLLCDVSIGDEINDRRLKIAAKKLRFGTAKMFPTLENINDGKVIEEIVSLYEHNFHDMEVIGLKGKTAKIRLDQDFTDWLFAIRHDQFKECYTIEEVLLQVQQWFEVLRTPLSRFYVFVMKSLLGFGSKHYKGRTVYLQEAKSMQEDLRKLARSVVRSNYPREWLGLDGYGIKRLVSGNRLVSKERFERVKPSVVVETPLATCKGIICQPNTKEVCGFITYRLGFESVRVFFVPRDENLHGNRFAGRMVEFHLAFTIAHGYEAFDVKLIKKYGCTNCSSFLEITSSEESATCRCGTLVQKDAFNEVDT